MNARRKSSHEPGYRRQSRTFATELLKLGINGGSAGLAVQRGHTGTSDIAAISKRQIHFSFRVVEERLLRTEMKAQSCLTEKLCLDFAPTPGMQGTWTQTTQISTSIDSLQSCYSKLAESWKT